VALHHKLGDGIFIERYSIKRREWLKQWTE